MKQIILTIKLNIMKTLNQLSETLKTLNLENPTFLVTIREDEYENTSDANYSENNSFETLEEAYSFSLSISMTGFESNSEYKEVEIVATTEDGDYEVLDSETYVQEYDEEDYGKFLISYRPNNNGIEGVEVEVINASTKFQVSSDSRYGTKFQVEDTKKDAIEFIYNKKLYMSMEDCEELFEMCLR